MRRRRIRKTGKVRRYRCTVSTFHYDPNAGVLREFEVHLRVARPGPIRDNRRTLGRRGLRHLQRMIFMRSGRWIPIGKVKIHYEREQAASRPEHRIAVEARSMKYQDRDWRATLLPSDLIPLRASKAETRGLSEKSMRAMDRRAQQRDIHEVAMAMLRRAERLVKKKQVTS